MEINQDYLKRFQIKKPAKNEERTRLVQELSDVTGWTKKAVYFSFVGLPDSWLEDALRDCRHYSNLKMRNKMFKEFIKKIRESNRQQTLSDLMGSEVKRLK